eukprot:TRINITY_DN3179_c2_g1_i4.p1 TRINITY_DN3179_c2_g1~~TRINITY_DN3179_c2_g1_i4.p1  ORF type:complete len:1001 (+),score=369.59 TRINITY_DN3179_c2_g1_i4:161-3163(+)
MSIINLNVKLVEARRLVKPTEVLNVYCILSVVKESVYYNVITKLRKPLKVKNFKESRGPHNSGIVKSKTTSVQWDEQIFTFKLPTELRQEVLFLELWNKKGSSNHDFLGEVRIPLAFIQDKSVWGDQWIALTKRSNDDNISGEIHLLISMIAGTEGTNGKITLKATAPSHPTSSAYLLSTLSPEKIKSFSPAEKSRLEVVFEILFSEQFYVYDLEVLMKVFIGGIQDRALLSKEELGYIFSNMELLYDFHSSLLEALENCILNNNNNNNKEGNEQEGNNNNNKEERMIGEGIGEIVLSRVNMFKIYAPYCSNHHKAIEKTMEMKEKRDPFKAFIDYCFASEECRGLTLEAYLIKPLQRICKYPLLIAALLQSTPDCKEKEIITQAYNQLKDIVDQINERTRTVERVSEMLHLQKLLDWNNAEDNNSKNNNNNFSEFQSSFTANRERYLVRRGPVTLSRGDIAGLQLKTNKKERNNNTASRTLFLFTDMLMIVKENQFFSQDDNNSSNSNSSSNNSSGLTCRYAVKEVFYLKDLLVSSPPPRVAANNNSAEGEKNLLEEQNKTFIVIYSRTMATFVFTVEDNSSSAADWLKDITSFKEIIEGGLPLPGSKSSATASSSPNNLAMSPTMSHRDSPSLNSEHPPSPTLSPPQEHNNNSTNDLKSPKSEKEPRIRRSDSVPPTYLRKERVVADKDNKDTLPSSGLGNSNSTIAGSGSSITIPKIDIPASFSFPSSPVTDSLHPHDSNANNPSSSSSSSNAISSTSSSSVGGVNGGSGKESEIRRTRDTSEVIPITIKRSAVQHTYDALRKSSQTITELERQNQILRALIRKQIPPELLDATSIPTPIEEDEITKLKESIEDCKSDIRRAIRKSGTGTGSGLKSPREKTSGIGPFKSPREKDRKDTPLKSPRASIGATIKSVLESKSPRHSSGNIGDVAGFRGGGGGSGEGKSPRTNSSFVPRRREGGEKEQRRLSVNLESAMNLFSSKERKEEKKKEEKEIRCK